MASNNSNMPKIVRNIYGITTERTTLRLPIQDSAAIYLGSFVSLNDPTNGKEYGVPAFTDDSYIFGIAVGFFRKGSLLPIWEDGNKQGSVTAATGELPLKYTASASNEESNASPYLEEIEILPIAPGDIIEVTLWGAGTVAVARATTTAAGTTGSSANVGVSMSVDPTYSFALTESTAAVAQANLDFEVVRLDGNQPKNSKRVYVAPIRAFAQVGAAS